MSTRFLAQVRPYGLIPAGADDQDAFKSLPKGAIVRVKIVTERSELMEHFYWALMTKVGDASGIGKYPLSDIIKYRTRHVEVIAYEQVTKIVPKSTTRMNSEEYRMYVDEAIELICSDYIDEMTPGELKTQVGKMCGVTYEEAFNKGKRNAKHASGLRVDPNEREEGGAEAPGCAGPDHAGRLAA